MLFKFYPIIRLVLPNQNLFKKNVKFFENVLQSSAQLHDAATECVCSLLQSLEDNNNQQALEQQLFSGVVALEESYLMSVAHEDQDKYALCISRIFVFVSLHFFLFSPKVNELL